MFIKEKQLYRQKHRAKFCCSYQRFGVLARRRQERPYAGGIFFLYGVPPLWSEAFVRLRGGRYGQELRRSWEKTTIEVKKNWRYQWQVFVGLWIKSSGYFKTGLTFFGHNRLWRRYLNQWGAAVRLPSVLFLLYSRKKRQLTIVFCLFEYFCQRFCNIEYIKATHIRVRAIELGQCRRFEQPLWLTSGYTVYGAPSWWRAIGQGQRADSQLPGSIRDVCVWVDNRDIIRHQSGQQRKLCFVYTAPNYELSNSLQILITDCLHCQIRMLELDILVSILVATVMT